MTGKLNAFADSLKSGRSGSQSGPKTLRETDAEYGINVPDDFPDTLLDAQDLAWLES